MQSRFLEAPHFPHLEIFENGHIYDHYKQYWRYPQKNDAIEITSPFTQYKLRTHVSVLVGYYFHAPWNTWPLVYPHVRLDFIGYPDYWAVSTGNIFSLITCKYLIPQKSIDGYLRVGLQTENRKSSTQVISRLIAKSFIPNPENKPEVNHIDGNKNNNDVSNLEWMFPWENVRHALQNNLRKSVMSDDLIHAVCQRLQDGIRVKDIMDEFNIPKYYVLGIKSGCHAHIADLYNFKRNAHF